MAATGLLARRDPFTGLRPVDMRRDLVPVADLIEVCFAATLDATGRAAIREMRTLSRTGPLLWVLARLGNAIPFLRGYVWVERDRIVGNVSLIPAGYNNGWVIANVAVAPDYRRRGIARRMMHAALAFVDRRKAFAVLQVEAANEGACALYEQLGFVQQRTFTRWRRAAYHRPPAPLADVGLLHPLTRDQADELLALASRLRPNERGGMGWLRPTRPETLRPKRLAGLHYILSGQRADFWVMRGEGSSLDAALRVEQRISGLARIFDVLVRPERQEQLAPVLLNVALRRFAGHQHAVITDHPADDTYMSDLLRENLFRPERTLVHMIRPAHGGSGNKSPVPTTNPGR